MGCCIAVAFVIALVRKAWFALLPGRAPVEVLFAPRAFRSAPGDLAPATDAPVDALADTHPDPHPDPHSDTAHVGSGIAMVLGSVAVTVALYAGVVAVLRWSGAAAPMDMGSMDAAPTISWTARDLIFGAAATAAVVLAAALYRRPVPARRSRGLVLTGAGGAWTALGALDMHVFGLIEIGHGSMAADVAFHGPGLLALIVGLATLLTRRTDPAPMTTSRPEPILR